MNKRRNSHGKTVDFTGMKYSPELIRQYEDPEFAEAAEKYERDARGKEKNRVSGDEDGMQGKGKHSKGFKRQKKKKYKWHLGKLIRNILIFLLLLFIIFTVIFYSLTGNFDKIDTEYKDFAISSRVEDELSSYRNIAILGVDARSNEGYDGSRTDAIIIMSINKWSGDVRLISVMRDSYLRMNYFDGKLILDKVTHAHHYLGGVNTCKSLNKSLDLNIDEFIIFNWKSVADAIDCLGGLELQVKNDEINDMNKWGPETARNVGKSYKKITKAGNYTLDGCRAVTYCRIRHTSGGDVGRGIRYKKVMNAFVKKLLSNPFKAKTLSDKVFPNIRTNMSQTQLYTLALNFPRFDFQKSMSWPKKYYAGLLSDGISYVVPTTLETNVEWLHRIAFGQKGYKVTQRCRKISQDIISDTGIE